MITLFKKEFLLVKRYFYITIGAFSAAFGTAAFASRAGLVTGGAAGIAVIAQRLFKLPMALVSIVLNIPLFAVGGKKLGRKFFYSSVYASLVFSLSLDITEGMSFIDAENDLLLSAVLSGACTGLGIGITVKNAATTGGSDMLAYIIHEKYRNIKTGDIIAATDTVIILAGMFVFGIQKSFYAVISVIIATKMITRISEGGRRAKGVMVMSAKAEEIAVKINGGLKRGATLFSSKGAYSQTEGRAVFTALDEREVIALRKIIEETDSAAFTVIADIREILGEFEKIPYRK